jgi:hypothetical protein
MRRGRVKVELRSDTVARDGGDAEDEDEVEEEPVGEEDVEEESGEADKVGGI